MAKIKRITISNLKAVSSLSADFNGCTAIITGGNNKGKSSFLKSLPERLRGNKSVDILKHGESEGSAEWELTTGEKFIWTFDDKKEKLVFISERNLKQSVTKDLSTYYFPAIFDVDEFLNDTPVKQRATLQKLSGIDFTEFDRVYKNAYEERTFANKRALEEKAKCKLVDPDLPEEKTKFDELENELNGIGVHNLKYETVVKGITDKKNKIIENELEVADLELKIKAIRDKNIALDNDISNGNKWITDPKNQRKENAEALKEQIEQIKKDNELIVENNKVKKQKELYEKLQLQAEECDKEVKRLESEKVEYLKNSTLPEGFGITDEGITYNGFAFNKEQLSSSGIYIAALKLAAIGLGEVKALHFDASFLDKNSLAEIEKWAAEQGLQLLIERPDFEGGEIEYTLIQNS